MDSQAGRIVVAYDGTEHSAAALDWAATEAQQRGKPLTVLHVLDYLSPAPGPVVMAAWTQSDSAPAPDIADEGAARARRLVGSIDVRALTQADRVIPTLVETSRDAHLLVVGTRGHGDLVGAVLGSVAFGVSVHAHCPVVVVRGDSSQTPGPHRPVVVGVDDSPGSQAALRYAADTAADTRAPLIVVTVYRPPLSQGLSRALHYAQGRDDERAPSADVVARESAEAVAGEAALTAAALHPELVIQERAPVGSPVGQLSTLAHGAGLLVVGSRSHGGLAGLVLGSVSHGVIHSAPCPVAVIHSPSPEPDPRRRKSAWAGLTAPGQQAGPGLQQTVGGVR